MKKTKERVLAKRLIAVLLIICNIVLVISGFAVLHIKEQGLYDNDSSVIINNQFEKMAQEMVDGPIMDYLKQKLGVEGEYELSIEECEELLSPENSNLLFKIYSYTGEKILGTYGYEEYRMMVTSKYAEEYKSKAEKVVVFESNYDRMTFNPHRPYDDGFIAETYEVVENEDCLMQAEIDGYYIKTRYTTVSAYLKENLTVKDKFYKFEEYINKLDALKYVTLCSVVVSLLLIVFFTTTLIIFEENSKDKEGRRSKLSYWILLDILAIVLIISSVLMSILGNKVDLIYYDVAICIFVIMLLCYVELRIISFADRIKKSRWRKYSILFRFAALCIKIAVWIKRLLSGINRRIPLLLKVCVVYGLLIVVEFVCIKQTFDKTNIFLIIWAVEKILFTPLIIIIVLNLRTLQKGGEQLAQGNLEYKINLRRMYGGFKSHGENLNSINIGMKKAVEEQMKSERLKTELITNVSHDIKTPLTSIISYVGLIKREDVQPESAKEYIEVLDRQSAKLKKLIDDLLEMSKASTGNIEVNLEDVDVKVLLSQTVGDYVERLEAKNITLITNYCNEEVFARADGQLLWRVLDNLMGNICKYTMEGTRVYINIEMLADEIKIIFKNISKNELNISADELKERFVRGDSSRNTEGSGLGLSIAENLVQLQDGSLDLSIDGDLFKAEVTLKAIT